MGVKPMKTRATITFDVLGVSVFRLVALLEKRQSFEQKVSATF
jgi:hypothetical protein